MIARLLTALAAATLCCSCMSVQRLAKAGAAAPTDFLSHGDALRKPPASESPFLRVWRQPADAVWAKAEKRKKIYIAPVNLDHLRPVTKPLSRVETRETSRQKAARQLAVYLREQMQEAFRNSPAPRYELADQPGRDTLNLELALVELNPNPISGGITRRAINVVAVPGAESIVGRPLKGSISMEGRLTDPAQRQSLAEFADSEHNRSALILSVHDFTAYSHSRKVIREWAAQIEQFCRSPRSARVKDSPAFMIWLW